MVYRPTAFTINRRHLELQGKAFTWRGRSSKIERVKTYMRGMERIDCSRKITSRVHAVKSIVISEMTEYGERASEIHMDESRHEAMVAGWLRGWLACLGTLRVPTVCRQLCALHGRTVRHTFHTRN